MLQPGVYPAAVTPFDAKGRIDIPAVARLLAWFESGGCKGAVLAGTNGEGPSLSAPEKRDLIAAAALVKGRLDLILSIATPSLDEAVWLCKQADQAGAVSVLLMPPFYFRDASAQGIEAWFRAVLDKSPLPVVLYNFPEKAGVTITADMLSRLADHDRFAGVKDSSGNPENIASYRAAIHPGHLLFVGNETLILKAMGAGWSGSISGAANVLPMWLSQVVSELLRGELDSASAKFELILPSIERLRCTPQPAMNKALLLRLGVLPYDGVRLPLEPVAPEDAGRLAKDLQDALGLQFVPAG
jgi:dihydrodipicolinate synthase/N-acetylneuraminate lyase